MKKKKKMSMVLCRVPTSRNINSTYINIVQIYILSEAQFPAVSISSVNMKRIIHLDFKGAPWKLPYLEEVILLAKSWGATGVLLEWEDTFPYTGELSEIGSLNNAGGDNLYSSTEVQHILKFLKDNDLEAIQLVQTIGHLEYVLKHPKYRSLREEPKSVSALCPSNPDSLRLVKAMLDQALDIQPDATYFHIGADEVWHTAVCDQCKQRSMRSEYGTESLYLEHIRELALFIKEKRPELTVLMWDDMLRPMSPITIRAFGLGDLVQPVLWDYNVAGKFRIRPDLWQNYKELFPRVWAASAFKGANGSCEILSPVIRYVSNHEVWMEEIKKYKDNIDIPGIILTGWSRYDHYATLCELLPVSMPTLYSCLKTLADPESESKDIEMEIPPETWPGEPMYRCVSKFKVIRERCNNFLNNDVLTTWMNPWQIEHEYTNPLNVNNILVGAQCFLSTLTELQIEMSGHLLNITGQRSTGEWLGSHMLPISRKLREVYEVAQAKLNIDASVKPI